MTSLNVPAPRSGGCLIEARDVYRSFGHTPALTGASLAVTTGEILAVMGPSGSGKSTLLHCLAGIFTPDKGEVWFDGERLDTLSDTRRTELRRHRVRLRLPVRSAGARADRHGQHRAAAATGPDRPEGRVRRAAGWLPRLGLDGLGARRTGELSGGEAQRVALARAVVAQPKVLFADEPTGSLDTLTGELVMDLLVGVAREEGTTVVLVTHDARVAAYADREVLVRDGKVIDHSDLNVKVGQ